MSLLETFKYKKQNKNIKKVILMNKKAFFSMHPGLFFMVGLIIGLGIAYYLAMQKIIPF